MKVVLTQTLPRPPKIGGLQHAPRQGLLGVQVTPAPSQLDPKPWQLAWTVMTQVPLKVQQAPGHGLGVQKVPGPPHEPLVQLLGLVMMQPAVVQQEPRQETGVQVEPAPSQTPMVPPMVPPQLEKLVMMH